mmetsp:Transcript_38379/g.127072  ORF Transcript_38379/g.127072 Transcript_38379/m.127072 type:complete len:253 (-) Transcript_38379:151-909(-)
MRLLERVLLSAASSPMRLPPSPLARSGPISANLFGDIMGDALKEQKPYDRPLLPSLVKKQPASYQLQEKMFSFSGEDFRVRDLSGQEVITIDGGNINLGGWVLDKLAFKEASSGAKFCSVERRAIAASTCYDIYSADGGECVAKVEREWMSMTPKYKFYYEGDANPFADFEAEGSFLDRTYTFKAGWGDTIARVRRAPELVSDLDTYVVDVAAGVDAAAILAMAVIIDEDHDEEDAKRAKEEASGGGGWPFG